MRLSEDEKLIEQSTVHEADNLVKKIRREKTFIKSLFGLRYIQDLLLILFPLVLTKIPWETKIVTLPTIIDK